MPTMTNAEASDQQENFISEFYLSLGKREFAIANQ